MAVQVFAHFVLRPDPGLGCNIEDTHGRIVATVFTGHPPDQPLAELRGRLFVQSPAAHQLIKEFVDWLGNPDSQIDIRDLMQGASDYIDTVENGSGS